MLPRIRDNRPGRNALKPLTKVRAANEVERATEGYVPCNLCGSLSFSVKFSGQDRQYKFPGKFDVVKCDTCGLMFVNPRPIKKSLSQYYPPSYWHSRTSSSSFLIEGVLKLHRKLMQVINYEVVLPEPKNGNLLDIGCGSGNFLLSAKQVGWDTFGVELSPIACESARRNAGLNVFNGTVDQASFPADFFDVVTMLHVLEHTEDPSETLCEIRRILKLDGLLVLVVPDAASLESKIFGSAWFAWELPRHLFHFSPATIVAMLEKNGFSVIDLKHVPHPIVVLSSFRYVFEDVKLSPKLGFTLSYPLSLLLAILLADLKTSGIMAIYARKAK